LAFNFNNDPRSLAVDPSAPPGDDARGLTGTAATEAADAPAVASTPVTSDNPQSAAFVRFNSCRWQQPAENGNTAFCTHREVKPYAGTTGFDPDAWCPDCQYYKLRRAPKKRQPQDEYTY
jgi:hypothetical protein